jgi:outer membrane protein TolC
LRTITEYNFLMRKITTVLLVLFFAANAWGQRILSLDSCRALAMQNNKQLLISQDNKEAAGYEHQAAKTNYLPKVGLDAGYLWNQKSIHLLNKDTRKELSNLGTSVTGNLTQSATAIAQQFPELAPLLQSLGTPVAGALNSMGAGVVDAFRTSTYNIYTGALVLTQPIYFGGRIKAYDNITNYTERLLGAQHDRLTQEVIYSIDQAYWQVVSLSGKKRLAESYLTMLQKLDNDIQKMYEQGVATKASTLTVRVKLNEADMTLTKVTDGLSLSKMLLCQICGLPVNSNVKLADEDKTEIPVDIILQKPDTAQAFSQRKDLQALEEATKIAEENIKLVKGTYLPSLSAFGGYSMMNPNVYNGFQNKFSGNISVGVTLHVPIWRWGEGKYRVRAAQALAQSQRHLYQDAKEKIDLEINQSKFKVDEAQKKLVMARKNQEKADENLHYADVGFHEGVIAAADMLEAQTAWVQARSEKLDAEIEMKLTEIYLSKSLGNLSY